MLPVGAQRKEHLLHREEGQEKVTHHTERIHAPVKKSATATKGVDVQPERRYATLEEQKKHDVPLRTQQEDINPIDIHSVHEEGQRVGAMEQTSTTQRKTTSAGPEKQPLSRHETFEATPKVQVLPKKDISECIPSIDRQSVNIGKFTFRSPAFEDDLLFTLDHRVHTVFDAWLKSVYDFPERPAFSYRKFSSEDELAKEFSSFTYSYVEGLVSKIASGIFNANLPSGQVGLFSENRVEWQFVNLALARMKDWILVPLEPRQGDDELQLIVNHAELRTIFVSSKQLERAMRLCLAKAPHVKNFVCLDHLTPDLINITSSLEFASFRVISLMELYKQGMKPLRQDYEHPSSDDLYLINYTSGTTGQPKGVMLTHENIIATSAAMRLFWQDIAEEQQKYLSFLPLSHVLQIVSEQVMMEFGFNIGYWSGDMKKLSEDISLFSPTLMASVPRVLQAMEEKIEKGIKRRNFLTRALFKTALRTSGGPHSALGKFWESLVFRRLRSHAGIPDLHVMLCGGASLNEETQSFLHKALNIPILQGYGCTETCAGGTMQLKDDECMDCIGAPLACCELRLRSVKEMGYTVDDEPNARGELLIRGYNISPGYFKEKALTAQQFTEDGFFATGDIAECLENGSFRIIDRKSNLVKLSQGEYVALEHLENIYTESQFVERMFLYADSKRRFIVAIVFPREDLRNEKQILESFDTIASQKNLKGYEKVKAVHIVDKDFGDIDSSLVSSTQKLKRKPMGDHFSKEIDGMYKKLESE